MYLQYYFSRCRLTNPRGLLNNIPTTLILTRSFSLLYSTLYLYINILKCSGQTTLHSHTEHDQCERTTYFINHIRSRRKSFTVSLRTDSNNILSFNNNTYIIHVHKQIAFKFFTSPPKYIICVLSVLLCYNTVF